MRNWATGRKPDLVDRVEIGERLGVSAATVSRWHRRSILPQPDLVLGPVEMWKWETIGEWAKDRSRFAKRYRRTEMPDLVDLAGIADRLQMNRQIIDNWHRNKRLPVPDYRWQAGDVWLWETIDKWQETQLAGRSLGLPQRSDRSVTVRPARPRGPKLQVAAVAAPPPVESPPPVDHRDVSTPVRPVATPAPQPAAEPVTPPAAVEVTPAHQPSPDPLGDIERLGSYFSQLAESLRT